jgi:hypothetical protein
MKRSIVVAMIASAFALPAWGGDSSDGCHKLGAAVPELAAGIERTCNKLATAFNWPPTNNGIIHYGDENDLSWMYVPPTAKPAFDSELPGTPRQYVEFGDENNLSWLYIPPTAKPAFADVAGTPRHFVEFGDENDLAWLYQAPTAKYADSARQRPYVGLAPQAAPVARQASATEKVK